MPVATGGLAMNTFLAQTLCESTITEDRSRFEMTFVDATGQRHKISIPFTIAADLIPVLESAAADKRSDGGDLTRIPRTFAVGHAAAERITACSLRQRSSKGVARIIATPQQAHWASLAFAQLAQAPRAGIKGANANHRSVDGCMEEAIDRTRG